MPTKLNSQSDSNSDSYVFDASSQQDTESDISTESNLFPAILCFIILENDIVCDLTVYQSVITLVLELIISWFTADI